MLDTIIDNMATDSLKRKIIKLLCDNYKLLPSSSINEIKNIIINAKQNEKEKQLITNTALKIIDMPNDVLIHACQFLEINDIYALDKTCRYLYCVAANPNFISFRN